MEKSSRLTSARKSILDCFTQQQEPLGYNQILSFLTSKGLNVNKTTIYRQLDYLKNNGLIQELDLGEGKKRYEIESRHHHHLVCTACNKIECVEFHENLAPQLAEITKSTGFKITGHIIEFLGLCTKCQIEQKKVHHV